MTVEYDHASDALADAFRAAWLDPGAVGNHDWDELVAWLMDMLADGWELQDAAQHLAQRVRQDDEDDNVIEAGIPADAPQWPFGGVPGWMRR